MSRPPQKEQTRSNARAYLHQRYVAHMKECDIADDVGGPHMREADFPIDEIPLWVVRAIAKPDATDE